MKSLIYVSLVTTLALTQGARAEVSINCGDKLLSAASNGASKGFKGNLTSFAYDTYSRGITINVGNGTPQGTVCLAFSKDDVTGVSAFINKLHHEVIVRVDGNNVVIKAE